MPSKRIRQVNELLQHELGPILSHEAELPHGALVTITTVDTSADLGYADVMVSVLPAQQQHAVIQALGRQAKAIRHLLAQKIALRTIPQVRFHLDTAEQRAAHIDRLIDKIHGEE